jgi:hypothetical protein
MREAQSEPKGRAANTQRVSAIDDDFDDIGIASANRRMSATLHWNCQQNSCIWMGLSHHAGDL